MTTSSSVRAALTIVVLLTSGEAAAQSHLGQPAANHVTLEVVAGSISGCGPPDQFDFVRNLPDGNRASGFFRVPVGQALIITDVDWQYNGGAAGDVQTLRLLVENLANPGIPLRMFESTIVLNAAGRGGASVSMTAGFVVSDQARICPDVSPGGGQINHILLRGYLMSPGVASANQPAAPQKLLRGENFPNPFTSGTNIAYDNPRPGRVEIRIYSVSGQLVRTLDEGERPAGANRVTWNAKDERGEKVPPGVYFYRLKAGDFEGSSRMVRLE